LRTLDTREMIEIKKKMKTKRGKCGQDVAAAEKNESLVVVNWTVGCIQDASKASQQEKAGVQGLGRGVG